MIKHMRKTCVLVIILVIILCLLPCITIILTQDGGSGGNSTAQSTTPSVTPANSEDDPMNGTEIQPNPDFNQPKYSRLMNDMDNFPISFNYNGQTYNGFAGFEIKSKVHTEVDRGIKTTQLLCHADIPATFRLETTVYPQESAYEYVVYIVNQGDQNTGTFSDLFYVIDFEGEQPMISGIKGDAADKYYAPYEQNLALKTNYLDKSVTGRPSHNTFPYYNLSYGNGGTFIAIGWPGTWFANYDYNAATKTTTLTCGQGGQGAVSTYVKPGETLRMPLMGFVEYEGLTKDEQTNAWRRYYINDVMRKIDGELTPTYFCISSGIAKETTLKAQTMLEAYKAQGIDVEAIWVDAGWYSGANGETVDWAKTGSIDIDYNRFPDGMKVIGDFAQENDSMFLLWFEPENMRLDTEAFLKGQPDFKEEWLLSTVAANTWLESRIINIGDAECREWIFNKICSVIDEAGVTGYRQDFNNDPAPAWKVCDQADPLRMGMTENQYVQGYLALWDSLIEKYGFLIDSCASGGGRNDLETMKRAVPLHYSDWNDGYPNDYDRKSEMTQVLYNWLPYLKNGRNGTTALNNIYYYRMNYAPFITVGFPVDEVLSKDAPWDIMRQAQREYNIIRDYFYGDYYMLTEPSNNKNRWDGRMFYCSDKGEGFALLACLESCTQFTNTVCLKGLDPNKQYSVKDIDGLVDIIANGSQLMEQGITVIVPENPYAAILLIKEI